MSQVLDERYLKINLGRRIYEMYRGINDLETAAYDIEDFIRSCKNGPKCVVAHYDAKLNAREQFGLNTEADLLAFISNNGLEDLFYINTEPWRKNPQKDKEVLIDAYNFCSNRKLGYIAFMIGFSGKYEIKSFHLDNDKLTLKDIGNNSKKLLR